MRKLCPRFKEARSINLDCISFLAGNQLYDRFTHKKIKSMMYIQKCLNVRQKMGTRSHSLALTVSQSLTLVILNNFCFHFYVQKSLSHSHSFSLSHYFNLSFNHSWHAEQVLFSSLCSKVAVYSRKMQCFFLTSSTSSPSPVTLDVIELVPS